MNDVSERNALIVIDVQKGFDDPSWGPRNNPDCEANVKHLITVWRDNGRPIVFVRHDSQLPSSPLFAGSPGNAFKPEVVGTPDLLVVKQTNSAFYGSPDLKAWLDEGGYDAITICGITTNHCCETTTRMAGNLGYKTTFVVDATHTFDRLDMDGEMIPADEISRVTAANLNGEFATVVLTRQLTEASCAPRDR